jgi:four helix bundle protein
MIRSYRDLDVYRMSMEACMQIFEISKAWPIEEKYSLIDQIRRSSRSVCANMGEAWRKRRYGAAFISKMSDSESEAAETQVWAEIAGRCGYIEETTHKDIDHKYELIIGKIVRMIDNPDSWLIGTSNSPALRPTGSPPRS